MAEWTIKLRDDNGGDVPADVRLRRLLKVMLRAFGFRCLDIRELSASDATEQEAMIDKTTKADCEVY